MSQSWSVEEVKELIQKTQSAGTDPVGMVTGLFDGLGVSASVTGAVLQEALKASGILLPTEVHDIFGSIQTLEKNGDQVQLVLTAQLEPQVRGIQVKLGPTVTAAIQKFPDAVALGAITGVSVNQFIWIEVQRVQFKENAGKRSVRVDTNFGGKEFPLG